MHSSSVPAKDIILECQNRGYLAKQLYIVSTRPANGIGPVMENLATHLAYQEELERDGTMFAAGPNWADDMEEWEGDGTVVYRAESLDQAKAIASRDPMHISGARTHSQALVRERGHDHHRTRFRDGSFQAQIDSGMVW